MSSFDDDDGPFYQSGSWGNKSNNTNSTDANTKKMKPLRFGMVELGIFIGLWVVMFAMFRFFNRRAAAKSSALTLPLCHKCN